MAQKSKTMADRFAATLSAYVGDHGPVLATDLKVFRDPKVEGCYAVRALIDGDTVDFLFTRGNFDDPDEVEEVEFETWPPVSGSPKFFT